MIADIANIFLEEHGTGNQVLVQNTPDLLAHYCLLMTNPRLTITLPDGRILHCVRGALVYGDKGIPRWEEN